MQNLGSLSCKVDLNLLFFSAPKLLLATEERLCFSLLKMFFFKLSIVELCSSL